MRFLSLFKTPDYREQLDKAISEVEAKYADLESREARARKSWHDAEQRLSAERAAHENTRNLVREQTDADLLLVSQRITADILAGKKPQSKDIAEQSRLVARQQSLAAAQKAYWNQQQGGALSVLAGLGLSSLFGVGKG